MADDIREFVGPDGTRWGVQVKVPGASNAMIVFHHPGGKTARLDRYAWHQWRGPEARSVTGSLSKEAVMKVLNLPINYLVVFSGDAIDMIFDSTGTVVWPT